MNDARNPFQSPEYSERFPVDEENDRFDYKPMSASQNARFINFIIDTIIIRVALFFLVSKFLEFILSTEIQKSLNRIPSDTMESIEIILGLLVWFAYYFILEVSCGRTIGKLLTGTMVVDEKGRKPTVGQILGRSLARLIPFEPFSFFGKICRGWHDTLSKTNVVKIATHKVPSEF